MKPSVKANYDYAVLQATDNSIPFYESLGFKRVGAVMLDEADAKVPAQTFVTSKTTTYTVRTGETISRIASKHEVDVWDVLFLNRHILGDAKPSSKPMLNTVMLIPEKESTGEIKPRVPATDIEWHVAKENETPKMIAKMYNVGSTAVVQANKGRFPGLMATSRLKEGTRIKVSHFDVFDHEYKAYAHWSFPDKAYEEPEPSYMVSPQLCAPCFFSVCSHIDFRVDGQKAESSQRSRTKRSPPCRRVAQGTNSGVRGSLVALATFSCSSRYSISLRFRSIGRNSIFQ